MVGIDQRVADVDRGLEHVASDQRDSVGRMRKRRVLGRYVLLDVGQAADQLISGKLPDGEEHGEARD